MVREILEYPDPRLREPGKPVAEVTDEIRALVDDMAETMYAAPGCGLAAPQIGVSLRVFVVDCAAEDEPSDLRVFINPEILEKDGQVVWNEGCLSFPGVTEEIKRAERVKVRALDRDARLHDSARRRHRLRDTADWPVEGVCGQRVPFTTAGEGMVAHDRGRS